MSGGTGEADGHGGLGGLGGLGYEQARDELAEVVRRLEQGGLSLDESVALWERGEALARHCEERLAGARERVQAVLDGAASDGAASGGTDGTDG